LDKAASRLPAVQFKVILKRHLQASYNGQTKFPKIATEPLGNLVFNVTSTTLGQCNFPFPVVSSTSYKDTRKSNFDILTETQAVLEGAFASETDRTISLVGAKVENGLGTFDALLELPDWLTSKLSGFVAEDDSLCLRRPTDGHHLAITVVITAMTTNTHQSVTGIAVFTPSLCNCFVSESGNCWSQNRRETVSSFVYNTTITAEARLMCGSACRNFGSY
jgi:hypothetical protein